MIVQAFEEGKVQRLKAMSAVRWKYQQLDIIGTCCLDHIQVASMTGMSVHEQQYWLRVALRLHSRKKMLKPLGKNGFSDPARFTGLSYSASRSTIHQVRIQPDTGKYQHRWNEHTSS